VPASANAVKARFMMFPPGRFCPCIVKFELLPSSEVPDQRILWQAEPDCAQPEGHAPTFGFLADQQKKRSGSYQKSTQNTDDDRITQCRRSVGLTPFDLAPFCAAPMPNQKVAHRWYLAHCFEMDFFDKAIRRAIICAAL
jgi:hypothetical protein